MLVEEPLLLFACIAYHVLSVFLIQTWFVPDEYWQSLEVGHHLVYRYGYLTWEWKEAIRSCLYPLLVSAAYYGLFLLNIDTRTMLILAPRLLQAIMTGMGSYCTVRLSCLLYGKNASHWTAFCIFTSWFTLYCGSRTLTNTAEMALTSCALYLYPWKKLDSSRPRCSYLWILGLACMIRPTAAALYLPIVLLHFWKTTSFMKLLVNAFLIGLAVVSFLVVTDYICYGRFLFTPYNFVKFNWVQNIGAFYGTHPWYWYFTTGFPSVMGGHVLPFCLSLRLRRIRTMLYLILWQTFVLSFLSHKEFRFLLPALSHSMCLCGKALSVISAKSRNILIAILLPAVAVNVFLAIYFGILHQRAPLLIMQYLASTPLSVNASFLFLLPCHSTPYYSHVHRNLTMRFLTCEPNLAAEPEYKDEADIFFENPQSWLEKNYSASNSLPTHVIIFDILYSSVTKFLNEHNFTHCYRAFHLNLPTSRVGQYIDVYCSH